jgi:hypothetical protein
MTKSNFSKNLMISMIAMTVSAIKKLPTKLTITVSGLTKTKGSSLQFNIEVSLIRFACQTMHVSQLDAHFFFIGIDGHSVFEISMRQRNKLNENWDLFVTYKGFGSRKSSSDRFEKICLDAPTVGNSINEGIHQNWILADVPISGQGKTETSRSELRSLFSSLLPGGGLIDIGLHGAYPYKGQCLDPLKDAMNSFILSGCKAIIPKFEGHNDEQHNVLLRKVRLDEFQYLLYLSRPVEHGQTITVDFPSVKTTLRDKKYILSDYCIMHKIDESIRTLCLDDLRMILAWLETQVLSMVGACKDAPYESFIEFCEHRTRLYWVGRRLFAAIGYRQRPSDLKLFEALYFGNQKYKSEKEWLDLSEEQKAAYADRICAQIEVELKYALDEDVSCGALKRIKWNSKAQQLFENVVSGVAKCVEGSFDEDAEWLPLSLLLTAAKTSNGALNIDELNGNSASSLGRFENGDVVAMETESESPSLFETTPEELHGKITHHANDITPFWGDISDDLIWQIVNSAFEAIRFDFFRTDNSDRLQVVLSSLHSSIFNGGALVQDPQPIEYTQVLSVATANFVDYVPNTYDLFLGLIWPTLGKHGWRILVGNSPNDVTFIPKSLSRKRLGTMSRYQVRHGFKSRPGKYGLHTLSKTTKRLFLAVANEIGESANNDDMPIDAVYDPKRTTSGVLDQFRAWLNTKFEMYNDLAKLIVNEKIDIAIRAIEECFDSCAPMLAPISNLPPYSNVDGVEKNRPVDAYQCEYLLQFLVSLLLTRETRSDSNNHGIVFAHDVRAFACDLLLYISEHYKDVFDERFHPPPEEYSDAGRSAVETKPSLWIEQHIHSIIAKSGILDKQPNEDIDMVDIEQGIPENSSAGTTNECVQGEIFEVIREEEKDKVTDFIRVTLENALPFFASTEDVRRKSGRTLGAPGLVCRHCVSQHGESKYVFNSVESLSACYPVLEKHLYKCTYTSAEIKQSVRTARALHAEQRKTKQNGSQQAFFTELWNRMIKNKPNKGVLQRAMKKAPTISSPILNGNISESDDDDFDGDNDPEGVMKGSSDEELVFTDHQTLLDFLRRKLPALPKNSRHDIQDALDTYYSCLDYAGRVYGTPSMPQHFSSHWLLQKVVVPDDSLDSSNQYVG